MRRIALLFCLFVVTLTPMAKKKDCHFDSLSGREFVFRDLIDSQKGYGYRWTKKPGKVGLYENGLKYKKYGPLKGVLLEEIFVRELKFGAEYYFVAVLENCETIYALKRVVSIDPSTFNVHDKHAETLQAHHQIVFPDALRRERKESIGKVIWINRPALPGDKNLFTLKKKVSYPVSHLERVTIVDFETTDFGPNRGICPYFAIVRRKTGEQGLLPFDPAYYFERDPVDPSWKRDIADAIRQERPLKGMTVEQLTLALGEPRQKLGGAAAGAAHKTWRFGKDLMVILRDGRVIWHGPAKKIPEEYRLPR